MCISIIMRASYDSIDNKQKMTEKVNKDITFIQFLHSTRLHSTELFKIFFSLLTLQLLFCKKLVGRETIKYLKFEPNVYVRFCLTSFPPYLPSLMQKLITNGLYQEASFICFLNRLLKLLDNVPTPYSLLYS